MKSAFIAALAFVFAAAAHAQQTVQFRSPAEAFSVNATATAVVDKTGPFLKVRLDQHLIWQPKQYRDPSQITGYSIGLAYNNDKGRWDTIRSSTVVPTPLTLSPGETKQQPSTTVLIPVDGISTFDDKWLVIAIHHASHGGQARTYAHSGKLSFK